MKTLDYHADKAARAISDGIFNSLYVLLGAAFFLWGGWRLALCTVAAIVGISVWEFFHHYRAAMKVDR